MSVTSDFSRRVNSIVVKNLPTDFNKDQLEELFSQFGRILSSKVLPISVGSEGGCGFVNYGDIESCNQAVEHMNNYVVNGFTLRVSHSASRPATNNFDRPQNGFRTNSESNDRPTLTANINPDDNNGTLSPSTPSRFSSFRPASERSSKPISINSTHSSTSELETGKSLWNNKSPISSVNQQMDIDDHEPFVNNKTYNVYLSNLEVPNVVFAATLDDYVNATLLITQMNKHEQLAKVQANSYKSKLVIGQACAALFNSDWYRARVLEIGENRVRVQYIDWGNTGWCDSTLEIRPLPNEYYKDPALCVKCILDGISSNEKLSDEQTNSILGILVLDLKLEMTVLRIENNIPYIRLNLGERNLNNEIREILSSSTLIKSNQIINFNSNKPEINLSEIYFVQLTTVDPQSEYFHVLLMRDCLATIMNVLKDWNTNKQPLISRSKANMLVCAQYDADDLWYRAWIENITDKGYHVYFVDFGNEEIVTIDHLSECPDILRNIPWQSIQIKLNNIKLTDDERYVLLRDFESDRLEMKIIQKNQDIYLVDLFNNGKLLVEHILDLRKKQQTSIMNEVSKIPAEPIQQPFTKVSTTANENSNSISLPIQPTVSTNIKTFQSTTTTNSTDTIKKPLFSSSDTVTKQLSVTEQKNDSTDAIRKPLFSSSDAVTKQLSVTEQNNDSTVNDNLTTLITEQRRQNRLLEQVLAAINTTNALLTQLVQR